MKIQFNYYLHGDTRIIKKFLFFPVIIKGEFRWLEKVRIAQRLNEFNFFPFRWENDYFLDN